MECGADDLVYSEPCSAHTPGWSEEEHAYRVASPDLQTFLVREHRAYALFLRKWAAADPAGLPDVDAQVAACDAKVAALKDALNAHLWHWVDEAAGDGFYVAYDVRRRAQVVRRTYQMAWPLWEGLAATDAQRHAAVRAVLAPDMRCASGIRSTSRDDPAYSNDNIIVP